MVNTLNGVWAAATTPMLDDLSVDMPRLVGHYRWLLAQGCDGVAALGTTGEANSFSLAERLALIEGLATSGLPMDRIMVGVGCCAIPDTVELTRASLDAGAAATLMLPPFYYKGVSDDGLFAAYAETIRRVGDDRLRIYVYDFPKMTGLDMSVDLLVRLHEAFPDTIVGVKDSSGNWPDMQETCRRIPGFGTFAGTERYLLDTLKAGGAGCISASANITARLCAGVYAAWKKGDVAAAEAAQAETTRVRQTLDAYPLIGAGKEILARHTGHAGWRTVRPPQVPLTAARAEALVRDLDQAAFRLDQAA